jgi:tryptophan-rich sensory protein
MEKKIRTYIWYSFFIYFAFMILYSLILEKENSLLKIGFIFILILFIITEILTLILSQRR